MLVITTTTVKIIKILLKISIIIIELITDIAETITDKKKVVNDGYTECLIKINITKKKVNKTTGYFIVCLIFFTFSTRYLYISLHFSIVSNKLLLALTNDI